MIPNLDILVEEIKEVTYASRTYKVVFREDIIKQGGIVNLTMRTTSEEGGFDRISGYVDDLDAIIQSIYLILSTERYKHIIYSWDYGIELVDLIGQPIPYVMCELPGRVKDALKTDNRIKDVVNFEFEHNKNKLYTTFTVITTVGEINAEMEVAL